MNRHIIGQLPLDAHQKSRGYRQFRRKMWRRGSNLMLKLMLNNKPNL